MICAATRCHFTLATYSKWWTNTKLHRSYDNIKHCKKKKLTPYYLPSARLQKSVIELLYWCQMIRKFLTPYYFPSARLQKSAIEPLYWCQMIRKKNTHFAAPSCKQWYTISFNPANW